MHFQNKILKYFVLLLVCFTPIFGKSDYSVESQPVTFSQVLNISHEGTLKQKDNGFIYLDVSNDFIHSVATLIDLPGELRTPPTSSRPVGAHISVFYEREEVSPLELGQTFTFEPKECSYT